LDHAGQIADAGVQAREILERFDLENEIGGEE